MKAKEMRWDVIYAGILSTEELKTLVEERKGEEVREDSLDTGEGVKLVIVSDSSLYRALLLDH